jgi:hypothetical protein
MRSTEAQSRSAADQARVKSMDRLPSTSALPKDPAAIPYFLWWSGASLAEFEQRLRGPDPDQRAYWLGALLREANTRDVWQFVSPQEIRAQWPRLLRHLGKSRPMWAYLLDMNDSAWPPEQPRHE